MKHSLYHVLAIGLTGSSCCLQVVPLNLLLSAPLRTKASAVLLKASMNRLPLRFTQTLQRTANEAKIEAFQNLYSLITVDLVEMPAGASDRVRTLSTVLQAKDDSMDAF